MNTSNKKWLLSAAAAVATFLPFGMTPSAHARDSARPLAVRTLTYREDTPRATTQEVRWGRGFYSGPYGYYGGPRYYPRYHSGYRGYAPYGGYYGPRYYGPGYGEYYYGAGGVRVGRFGVLWR